MRVLNAFSLRIPKLTLGSLASPSFRTLFSVQQPSLCSLHSRTNPLTSQQQMHTMTSSIQPTRHYFLRSEEHLYCYKPLQSNEIRLLRLHSNSDPTSPLHGTIFHANASEAPPYTALSYAWGDPKYSGKHQILLNSAHSVLPITTSLNHALLRLRSEVEDKVMWVDAVCINQSDVAERSEQTAHMREIYQNAESVAVWLGGDYNNSAGAIQFARDAVSCTSSDDVEDLLMDGEEELTALVRLFRRQYWWRIWVIQEVQCGQQVRVYCGDEEVEWNILDMACEVFKDHENILKRVFYRNHTFVRTLVAGGPKGLQLSRYSPGNPAPPLLELLISHKGKKATEPKDKVFALVGISDSRDHFEIDYSKSVKQIFAKTAKLVVESTQRLDVICLKQSEGSSFNLPSWAPNWVRGPAKDGSTLVGLHHCQSYYKACNGSKAKASFHGRDDKTYIMKANGIMVDTITTVGALFIKKKNPSDPVPPLRAFVNWWELFNSKFTDTPASLALFGRVLSCGNWGFEDTEEVVSKLDNVFTLSEELLQDGLGSRPISRSSTISSLSHSMGSIARSMTSNSNFSVMEDEEDDGAALDAEEREKLGTILSVSGVMNRRRLVISNTGLTGLGLWNVEVGDVICILNGCRFPVILREVDDHYVLIGEAYVDGIMFGEAFKDGKERGFRDQEFEIH